MAGDGAPRVVVAGGGPAAIEGVLALRGTLPGAEVHLIAPDEDFVYRPQAVLEPFGGPPPERYPLAGIAERLGLRLHRDAATGADVAARRLLLASGRRLGYDALLVTIGARQIDALPGSTTFWGRDGDPALKRLLERLRSDRADVVFAAPPRVAWTLPLYELALGAADWSHEHGGEGRLTVVTPEPYPLAVFGGAASAGIEKLLAEAGVGLITSTDPAEYCQGLADGDVGGEVVISLPRLVGRRIPGLPASDEGFLRVDDRGRVLDAPRVYAAGDVIDSPIKQGGLGAQQADAAAAAIVADLTGTEDGEAEPSVLRANLLAPGDPRYLRRALGRREGSAITGTPVWWPGAKVFGKHLSPFLAELVGPSPAVGGASPALGD